MYDVVLSDIFLHKVIKLIGFIVNICFFKSSLSLQKFNTFNNRGTIVQHDTTTASRQGLQIVQHDTTTASRQGLQIIQHDTTTASRQGLHPVTDLLHSSFTNKIRN